MKINSLLLIATLFCANHRANAQTENIILKVGDKAPQLKAYKWVKGTPIKEFKRGRVYLVDFGATWCAPCAVAIPHLTELASKYKKDVDVVSVFVMEYKKDSKDVSYVSRVEQYVKHKGENMQYSVAIDNPTGIIEDSWLTAAGLNGIPQTFIIDKNGMIAWIGTPDPIVLNKILDFVKSDSYSIGDAIEGSKIKKASEKPQLDQRKPLFTKDNGGENNCLYRSILTSFEGERGYGNNFSVEGKGWIKTSDGHYMSGVQQIGISLLNLYYLAYGDTIKFPNIVYTRQPDLDFEYPDTITHPNTKNSYGTYWYHPVVEAKDNTPFIASDRSIKNRFNYSLLVADTNATAKLLQKLMRRDLKNYFGYEASVEERMMPCWKLIATNRAKIFLKAKHPGAKYTQRQINDTLYQYNNAIMKDILIRFILTFSYSQISFNAMPNEEAPFVDETNITNDFDYDLTVYEGKAFNDDTRNWTLALVFLHRLGLDLVKGEKLTKVIVIRDPHKQE